MPERSTTRTEDKASNRPVILSEEGFARRG
jgi:hypothetical protein